MTFFGISGRAKSGNTALSRCTCETCRMRSPTWSVFACDEGLPPLRITHVHLLRPILVLLPAAATSYSSRWRPASDVQSSLQVIKTTLLQQPLLCTFEDVIQGWGEYQIKVPEYERAYLDIFTSTNEHLIPGGTRVTRTYQSIHRSTLKVLWSTLKVLVKEM